MSKKIKKKVKNQVYENYWNLTMAWTNFNGSKFLKTLKITVDFIDNNKKRYAPEVYDKLQQKISTELDLDCQSVRKGVNELVKLGFVNSFLRGYHPLSKDYLNTTNEEERNLLLSKIVYSNASFQRSVTKESDIREINFVINTLEHLTCLEDKYLGVLISTNIANYPQGYISFEDLDLLYNREKRSKFEQRKYNQIGYLKGLLKKLNGIVYRNGKFCLEKDTDKIQVEDEQKAEIKGRDPYLQRIYKQQLKKESFDVLGRVKCMVERLEYPVLIASHIKPFRNSNKEEAFDPNNGLLLSKNLDSLFDLNYISFTDDGYIIFYDRTPDDIKQFWKTYQLDKRFINPERLRYLSYHRKLCENKNKV